MFHIKTSKSGLYIIIGIVILTGAIYFVSANFTKDKKNTSTAYATSSSCAIGPGGLSCEPGTPSTSLPADTATTATTTVDTATTSAPTTVQTDTPQNAGQDLASQPTTTITPTASYETVNVGHTAFALDPETVNLKAGKSYKLVITPTENGGGCMSTMTIPGLDNNIYPVRAGNPITITIDNAQAGNYEVVCGAMGMHQGYIVIQ